MNCREFNEKYKNYLVENHYGCNLSLPEVISYLDKEFSSLIKIPFFKYYQIKMKFNKVRFYADIISPEKILEIEEHIEKLYNDE